MLASPAARLLVPHSERALLADPQTSAGLLVACTADSVDSVLAVFERLGFATAAEIGEVLPAGPAPMVVR